MGWKETSAKLPKVKIQLHGRQSLNAGPVYFQGDLCHSRERGAAGERSVTTIYSSMLGRWRN